MSDFFRFTQTSKRMLSHQAVIKFAKCFFINHTDLDEARSYGVDADIAVRIFQGK
ncbi:hypothetical protein D3C76_1859740 [compost metagenome]